MTCLSPERNPTSCYRPPHVWNNSVYGLLSLVFQLPELTGVIQ